MKFEEFKNLVKHGMEYNFLLKERNIGLAIIAMDSI